MQKYNEKLKSDNEKQGIRKAGGVYIPPHKLRALQQEKMLRQNLILIRDLCATQHNHDMTREERRTEMKTIMDTATFALDWKP